MNHLQANGREQTGGSKKFPLMVLLLPLSFGFVEILEMKPGTDTWKRYLYVALTMFIMGWLGASLRQMWQRRNLTWRGVCAAQMHTVYVAAKRVAARTGQARPSGIEVARLLHKGFTPTKEEDLYLGGSGTPVPLFQRQTDLLCPEDPKHPVKLLMTKTNELDFEPSYQLFLDSNTVAFCPFHRQAVLDDGSIQQR